MSVDHPARGSMESDAGAPGLETGTNRDARRPKAIHLRGRRQVRGERRAGMVKSSPEQAMVVLESGLARWFEEQGVEIE
jgi:hypothetical protein